MNLGRRDMIDCGSVSYKVLVGDEHPQELGSGLSGIKS